MSSNSAKNQKALMVMIASCVIAAIGLTAALWFANNSVSDANKTFTDALEAAFTEKKNAVVETAVTDGFFFHGYTSTENDAELVLFVVDKDVKEEVEKIDKVKKEVTERLYKAGESWVDANKLVLPGKALENCKYSQQTGALYGLGSMFKTSLLEQFNKMCERYVTTVRAAKESKNKFIVFTINEKDLKGYTVDESKKCVVANLDLKWTNDKVTPQKVVKLLLTLLETPQVVKKEENMVNAEGNNKSKEAEKLKAAEPKENLVIKETGTPNANVEIKETALPKKDAVKKEKTTTPEVKSTNPVVQEEVIIAKEIATTDVNAENMVDQNQLKDAAASKVEIISEAKNISTEEPLQSNPVAA